MVPRRNRAPADTGLKSYKRVNLISVCTCQVRQELPFFSDWRGQCAARTALSCRVLWQLTVTIRFYCQRPRSVEGVNKNTLFGTRSEVEQYWFNLVDENGKNIFPDAYEFVQFVNCKSVMWFSGLRSIYVTRIFRTNFIPSEENPLGLKLCFILINLPSENLVLPLSPFIRTQKLIATFAK